MEAIKRYLPTAKSYFSGAGGLDCGVSMSGIKVIQSLEIDPVFSTTLKLNFDHEVLTTDITNMEVLKQPKSDIILGTYPCKKYSTIADLHGTRTGDELYLHFFRHMALEQPEVFVLENVPGMKKFPVVMEAMTKLPQYYVTVFCPVNSRTFLPQERKRLIIFGTRKNFLFREPSYTSAVKLRDIIETDVNIEVPDCVYNRLNGKYRDKPIISDPLKNDVAPTCVSHYAKDKGTRLVVDKKYPQGVRPYTVREYARLQGFPDWFQFAGTDNQAYTQIGNAVSVPVGQWIGRELIRYFN
jgi:DNA (cytosine-5)-methyltransferase 1